jgi:hypothetical protein
VSAFFAGFRFIGVFFGVFGSFGFLTGVFLEVPFGFANPKIFILYGQ